MHTETKIPTGYRYIVRNARNEVLASDVVDVTETRWSAHQTAIGMARYYRAALHGESCSVSPVYSMGEFAPR
jgi:hypothetical protein